MPVPEVGGHVVDVTVALLVVVCAVVQIVLSSVPRVGGSVADAQVSQFLDEVTGVMKVGSAGASARADSRACTSVCVSRGDWRGGKVGPAGRINERVVDVPVLQMSKESVEVVRLVFQDRTDEHIIESSGGSFRVDW